MDYYYTDSNNQTRGPVTIAQLHSLAASGALNASCMVAAVGTQQWTPIGTIVPSIAPAPSSPNEPLAIWSFVLSLIGLLCCGSIVSLPAIICGHLALSNIHKKSHLQGAGLAIAGLIIGYIGTLFWLIGTLFWIVYLLFFGGMAFLEGLSK
jgi:hypothetical protein